MNKEQYDGLLNGSLDLITIEPDGQIKENHTGYNNILCGSFNPLHDGHRSIYHYMPQWMKCYEISITNRSKEEISYNDLLKRISQFEWYAPVVITNSPLFIQKIRLFNNAVFHVGADTYHKMVDDYTLDGIAGLNCKIAVSPRITKDGTKLTMYDFNKTPHNVVNDCQPRSDEIMRLSSSQIRNESPI